MESDMDKSIEKAFEGMTDRDLLLYIIENQLDIKKKLEWLKVKDYDHNKHTDWFEELIDKYAKK